MQGVSIDLMKAYLRFFMAEMSLSFHNKICLRFGYRAHNFSGIQLRYLRVFCGRKILHVVNNDLV